MVFIKKLVFIILLLLQSSLQILPAQESQRTLTGMVIDAESRQPLPGAYIRIAGTTTGTTSNADGAYRLLLPGGRCRIAASYLGYLSDTLHLSGQDRTDAHTFALRLSSIALSEVLVIGDRSNPAEEIIKRSIEKKRKLRTRMQTYEFSAYTKMTMRATLTRNKSDTLASGEVMTTSHDTILAGGVLETQIRGYWKDPNKFKEVVVARKQTRNIAPEINILGLANIPNLNDDRVKLYDKLIVGPTAPDALDYYSYELIDTVSMNKIAVWRIRMKPKNAILPLFDGTVTISDDNYRIVESTVQGNDALSHSVPLASVRIHQLFGFHSDPFLWPMESNLSLEIKFPGLLFPFLVDHIGVVHDYSTNNDITDSLFDQFSVSVHPHADNVDSVAWLALQAPPLTVDEKKAYHFIDSLYANSKAFAAMMWIMRLPFWLEEQPLTSLADYFRFNRVEGAFLGLGYDSKAYFGSTHLVTSAGYAFARRSLNYGLEIEQPLTASKRASVGGTIHRSLLSRSGEEPFDLSTNTFFALFTKEDPVDYFEGEGFSLFAKQQLSNELSLQVRYCDELQRSVQTNSRFSFFDTQSEYRLNPPILDGRLRSTVLSLRYDTRKLIQFGPFNVPDETNDSWNIGLEFEYTDHSMLRSDFTFNRVSLLMHMRKHLLGDRSISIFSRIGYSGRALPPQRLFDLPYGVEDIMPLGAFKTLRVKEFAGDRMALVMVEWNLSGMLFRPIDLPIVRDLQLILFAGSAWSDISPSSRRLQAVEVQTAKNLFHEAGFGLGNLPLGFRLDITWRLTHRNGKNMTLTLGSPLF